jgi:Uma2 family endonuclease
MTPTARSGVPGSVTAEQLQELPAADGTRYELVDGELHTMTPSGYRHGRVSG